MPNQDDIDRQEFGRLQEQVSGLRRDMDRVASQLDAMSDTLDEVRQQLTEARGGWKAMMLLGGASAAVGGLVVKVLGSLTKGPL